MPEYTNIRQRTTRESHRGKPLRDTARQRRWLQTDLDLRETDTHAAAARAGKWSLSQIYQDSNSFIKNSNPQYHLHTPRTSERRAWYGSTLAQSSPQDHTHLQKA